MRHYQIPAVELLGPGHLACPGCGAAVGMRLALKALGKKTILVIPACCWSIVPGAFPHSAIDVPIYNTAFETGGAAAAGIVAALDILGDEETTVVTWAGDGGTFDIGIQSLSGAAERNDNFIYICNDNEAYMNTGIQRSSATPYLAWTTTTPAGNPKERPKKNMLEIMADHRIPYVASVTIAYPEDMIRKIRKAKSIYGTKFIHLLSPCPPGWRIPSEKVVHVSRLAVRARVFPLLEIEDGERYTVNVHPDAIPVREYLKAQGRFSHLTEEQIDEIQSNVDREWRRLLKRTQFSSAVFDVARR
ncbi:MAG: 3-methyl-2-oxobutanoate dehydrogenase subunit beta [Deltaproteobacteria bacterium]|nr:3-methyl-2-oxobutanoate dehydrogenase subunit beta [Deltaproteobacteria bacterium]MBW2121650.1 3-methyl-2-oxobutanoate dehydrogenase subunit beta [Deltaproteobacteria bacterium]